MLLSSLLPILALLTSTATTSPYHSYSKDSIISAQNILAIAPETSTCTSALFPSECISATDAAPLISLSFTYFNITSFGTQAALLSLILYETGSLKYNKNHWPGIPGQGTRNMQSPVFNLEYAKWIAENMPETGISESDVEIAEGKGVNAVVEMLNAGGYGVVGFASAAWFLKIKCEESVEEGLEGESEEAWEVYLTSCVGTTATEDRLEIWRQAIALGGW